MATPEERAQIARENGEKGGRPKGKLNKRTLQKMKVQKKVEQRYMRVADKLANAQISLATGQQFLYKIEKEWIKTDVKKDGEEIGYWRSKKPEIVESQSEIEGYLEDLVDEENREAAGEPKEYPEEGATYYFITAKEPNNEALKDIQNRVFGKPKETIDVNQNHTFTLKGLGARREQLKKLNPKDYKILPPATITEKTDPTPVAPTVPSQEGPSITRRPQ